MKDDANKTLRTLNLAKRLVFVTIIVYIVAFFAINSSYLSKDNLARFSFTLKKTLTESYAEGTQKKISLMYNSDVDEVAFKDGFAILSSGTLSVYSADLSKFSSHSIGYKDPVLSATEDYIFCFDRGGKHFAIYDSFSLVKEVTLENEIINAAMSDDGYLAVITNEYGYKGLVTIYDEDLTEIMKWYSADYYLLHVGFTQKNTVSAVAIKHDLENIDTYIVNLNYKVGEERLTICADNRFPLSAKVKSDSSYEIVTDIDVITLRNDGYKSIYDYGTAEIYSYRQFDDYIAVIALEDSIRDLYRLTVSDPVGNVMFERILEGYKDIRYYNGNFFILEDGRISAVTDEGMETGLTEVSSEVYKILVSKGFTLLIEPEKITAINTAELFEYSDKDA